MDILNTALNDIPQGHGLSFKKGISDGLLGKTDYHEVPNGHDRSYQRGLKVGEELKGQVASSVKD